MIDLFIEYLIDWMFDGLIVRLIDWLLCSYLALMQQCLVHQWTWYQLDTLQALLETSRPPDTGEVLPHTSPHTGTGHRGTVLLTRPTRPTERVPQGIGEALQGPSSTIRVTRPMGGTRRPAPPPTMPQPSTEGTTTSRLSPALLGELQQHRRALS